MTTISMAPGANVINTATHDGVTRMSMAVVLLAGVLRTAIRGLEAWHCARVAARNDAALAVLVETDFRVRADLQAARCRKAD